MAVTRTTAQIAADISNRATANELAKKENEVWFNKFLKDMPELDDELNNYAVWIYSIKDVCKKQNCIKALQQLPEQEHKLDENDSKNINMLMTHTMNEHIRPFMVKENAFLTYECMQTYRPKGNEQRVDILAGVKDIDYSDLKAYVHDMRALQARLIFIDPNREHPETKAPAYMTRLLDNLSENQKQEVFWLRDKWRSRESATDLDCFQVGKKLQEFFSTKGTDYAGAAYEKRRPQYGKNTLQRGPATAKNPCGVPHFHGNGHSWEECFSNPINAQKKTDYYAKFRGGSRGGGNSQGNSQTTILQARLAASEALNKVYAQKKRTYSSNCSG